MFGVDRKTNGGWESNGGDEVGVARNTNTPNTPNTGTAGAAATAATAANDDSACDEPQMDRFEQLHRRLKRIVKARGSLDLQEAEALREAESTRMWRRYGYSSLVEYMELELGYTPRAAVERLRVANALPQLPQIAAAIEQGDLTFCGARELTRVATPETEHVWLGATKDMNVREVEQAVSGHRPGELPSDPPDPRLQTRFLRFEVREDVYALDRQVRRILDKERGARVDDSEFMEALYRAFLAGARGRTRDEGRGDDDDDRSGVEQGDRDLGGAGDRTHGHGAELGDRTHAAYSVAVTVCKQCRRGWQDGAGVVVEMSPPAVERALCDSQDIGLLDGDEVKRAKQSIPPNVRRTVMRRDHSKCQVPGCRSARNVDVHHIIHRENGGTHTVDNLLVLCEAHHLATHDGSVVIERINGEVKVVREARNAFTRVTRAIDAARVLRERGLDRAIVRNAIEKTRTHVGTNDLSLAQWIAIAERYAQAENRS